MTTLDLRRIVVGLLFYVVAFAIMALIVAPTADTAPGQWLSSVARHLAFALKIVKWR
ncbi:MAG: hypothetical protein JO287_08735 [Pseudonocardiales bacterium]|nr:hypothetical protein [Pseudonocardiales bacterium]